MNELDGARPEASKTQDLPKGACAFLSDLRDDPAVDIICLYGHQDSGHFVERKTFLTIPYHLFMASERYIRVWDADQQKAVRVHRILAAQQLGRPLTDSEVVHHINGDRSDNRPENLQVLRNQAYHMALEHLQRKLRRGVQPLFSTAELLDSETATPGG